MLQCVIIIHEPGPVQSYYFTVYFFFFIYLFHLSVLSAAKNFKIKNFPDKNLRWSKQTRWFRQTHHLNNGWLWFKAIVFLDDLLLLVINGLCIYIEITKLYFFINGSLCRFFPRLIFKFLNLRLEWPQLREVLVFHIFFSRPNRKYKDPFLVRLLFWVISFRRETRITEQYRLLEIWSNTTTCTYHKSQLARGNGNKTRNFERKRELYCSLHYE